MHARRTAHRTLLGLLSAIETAPNMDSAERQIHARGPRNERAVLRAVASVGEHTSRLWTGAASTRVRLTGDEGVGVGDGFLATFDAATRAVRAATEIVNQARNAGLEVRAAVHTGEVEVRPDDVVGLAVTIAKRICDLAGPADVLVSEGVKGHL